MKLKRSSIGICIKTLIIAGCSFLFILPLAWMILSSLKTASEVFAYPFKWFPAFPQWSNYVYVWFTGEISMLSAFFNSFYIVIFSIAGSLAISALAAYAFAKVDFKGKNFVFMLFLSSMMIPGQVTIIPRFMLFKTIGLYNSLWAIILPAWFAVTQIFLLRQFFLGLPNDLMEAAKIDGAGHLRIFSQIILPLATAALISLMILTFIGSWNEYLAPLIFLVKPAKYTVAQAIRWYMMDEANKALENLTMAAATSAVIPVVIMFVAFQKYFIEGIATAGMKG